MTTKSAFVLNEALSMNPAERARIAHCLIQSLEEPFDQSVDEQWIQLSQKRLEELESGAVQPVSWEQIKKEVRS